MSEDMDKYRHGENLRAKSRLEACREAAEAIAWPSIDTSMGGIARHRATCPGWAHTKPAQEGQGS